MCDAGLRFGFSFKSGASAVSLVSRRSPLSGSFFFSGWKITARATCWCFCVRLRLRCGANLHRHEAAEPRVAVYATDHPGGTQSDRSHPSHRLSIARNSFEFRFDTAVALSRSRLTSAVWAGRRLCSQRAWKTSTQTTPQSHKGQQVKPKVGK